MYNPVLSSEALRKIHEFYEAKGFTWSPQPYTGIIKGAISRGN